MKLNDLYEAGDGSTHPAHDKELRKKYDDYKARSKAAGQPYKSWPSWALQHAPSKAVAEGFYDGKFGGGIFGKRSHEERVRDEARDLSANTTPSSQSFNITINGKLWTKEGQPVTFATVAKANSAVAKIKARMAERGQQGEVNIVKG